MNIQEKIEEIKKKPEHIRVRYAWFLTAICMFFVLLIWEVSFRMNMESIQNNPDSKLDFDGGKAIKDIQNKKEDLKKIKDNISGVTEKSNFLLEKGKNPENESEIRSELKK